MKIIALTAILVILLVLYVLTQLKKSALKKAIAIEINGFDGAITLKKLTIALNKRDKKIGMKKLSPFFVNMTLAGLLIKKGADAYVLTPKGKELLPKPKKSKEPEKTQTFADDQYTKSTGKK